MKVHKKKYTAFKDALFRQTARFKHYVSEEDHKCIKYVFQSMVHADSCPPEGWERCEINCLKCWMEFLNSEAGKDFIEEYEEERFK